MLNCARIADENKGYKVTLMLWSNITYNLRKILKKRNQITQAALRTRRRRVAELNIHNEINARTVTICSLLCLVVR